MRAALGSQNCRALGSVLCRDTVNQEMGKQAAEKLAGACKIGSWFLHPRNSPRNATDPNRGYVSFVA